MSKFKLCIECESEIEASEIQCVCGWIQKKIMDDFAHRRCAYQIGEKRCVFPGAITNAYNTWYCPSHYHCIEYNDRVGAEILLNYANDISKHLLFACCTWRDVLSCQSFKKTIEQKTA